MPVEIVSVQGGPINPLTAEAVAEGHPDKSADVISALIVNEHLRNDSLAHVAAETFLTSKGPIVLAGEITSRHPVSTDRYDGIVRDYLTGLGWSAEFGYDVANLPIYNFITGQSPDIAMGVEQANPHQIGAGDQGITIGFSIRNGNVENDSHLPIPSALSKDLLFAIDRFRRQNPIPLKPDMKSQLDVEYDSAGNPVGVKNIVFALSHTPDIDSEGIRRLIAPIVVPVFDRYRLGYNLADATINGTHRFVLAGAMGDTGLTGRKIVVDQYGPDVPVGGGAFHGKDPSKADVTGAYLARWIAQQVVGNGLAEQCLVKLNWAIGRPDPFSVQIQTGGTETRPMAEILHMLQSIDMSLGVAIARFGLRDPLDSGVLYDRVAAWGPFGNQEDGSARPWNTIVEPSKWKEWEA